MDYASSLKYLQDLLTNKQAMQGRQFNQGLGFQESALGQHGQEFDANLALQKVISDWQNQLATRAQTQAEQNQQFGQNLATRQYNDVRSGPSVGMIAGNKAISGPSASDSSTLEDFLARIRGVQQNSLSNGDAVSSYGAQLSPFRNYGDYGPLSFGLIGDKVRIDSKTGQRIPW